MKRFATQLVFFLLLLNPVLCNARQERTALPSGDERYKTDILLVVAHPDDEGAATPYLARALDEHKRVTVVFCTRGSSGANEAGAEQAAALGAVREIEARNALTTLGITNVWFLGGKDTASQNVLLSLANWDHGESLAQLVRLVRLTRPEVILTFLPGTFIGEDHGDHQASGLLATEAFDLAGDPVAFPEQVAGPTKRLEPYLENLRPWQPKKIYYFPDADREDIFRGKGPDYSVKEIPNQASFRTGDWGSIRSVLIRRRQRFFWIRSLRWTKHRSRKWRPPIASGRSPCISCLANRWSAAASQEIFSKTSLLVRFLSPDLRFLRNPLARNYQWNLAARTVSTWSFAALMG